MRRGTPTTWSSRARTSQPSQGWGGRGGRARCRRRGRRSGRARGSAGGGVVGHDGSPFRPGRRSGRDAQQERGPRAVGAQQGDEVVEVVVGGATVEAGQRRAAAGSAAGNSSTTPQARSQIPAAQKSPMPRSAVSARRPRPDREPAGGRCRAGRPGPRRRSRAGVGPSPRSARGPPRRSVAPRGGEDRDPGVGDVDAVAVGLGEGAGDPRGLPHREAHRDDRPGRGLVGRAEQVGRRPGAAAMRRPIVGRRSPTSG